MSALTLRLQDSLNQKIRQLANQQQISLSDFARNALETYTKQVEKELQLQEMIKAAQAMQHNPIIAEEVNQLTQALDFENEHQDDETQQGWWK